MDEKTKQEKINDMADKIKFVFDVLGTKKNRNTSTSCGGNGLSLVSKITHSTSFISIAISIVLSFLQFVPGVCQ